MPGLPGFVWTVYDDMDAIVGMRNDLFVPPEPEAVDERDSLASFAAWLGEAWPGVDDTKYEVILEVLRLTRDDPDSLARRGLSGVQLETKLLAWRRARAFLQSILEQYGEGEPLVVLRPGPPTDAEPEPPLRRYPRLRVRMPGAVLRRLKRVLSHADTILGSLLSLVPGLDPLKELKETTEKICGDAAEDAPQ